MNLEEGIQQAMATCRTESSTTTWTDGTGVANGHPFLDAETNRWISEKRLLDVLKKETNMAPGTEELEAAMDSLGSRKQECKPSIWTGREYERVPLNAWLMDRPLDRTEPEETEPEEAQAEEGQPEEDGQREGGEGDTA